MTLKSSVKELGYLLENPTDVFYRYWKNKRDEGVPQTMKGEYEEAFRAGCNTMRDLAEAYGAYVLIYHEENGPCRDTGNTPVSFKEWATCEESGRVLEGEDYICPMESVVAESEAAAKEAYDKLGKIEPVIISEAEIMQAFQLGFWEGDGDMGLTYNADPEDPRSIAYDKGRDARRTLFGLDEDDHPLDR